MMSSTNGILSPPSTRHYSSKASTIQGKRKRTESHGPSQANGIPTPSQLERSSLSRLEQFQGDFLVVAQRIDSSPSIIDHQLTTPKDSSTEHDTKRTKRIDRSEADTIKSKLESQSYNNYDEIKSDVSASSAQLVEDISARSLQGDANAANQSETLILTLEDRAIVKSILNTKRELLLLIGRELTRPKSKAKEDTKDDELTEENSNTAEANSIASKGVVKTSLTALANSGSSLKQVYSSFRDPLQESKELHNIGGPGLSSTNAVEETFTLNEAVLRSGLWQTNVDQLKIETEGKKKYLSLGKIFGQQKALPELAPPKQSKTTTTRKNTIDFVQPLDQRILVDSESDAISYTYAPLQTGSWLSYNNVFAVTQSTSSETKQRQRARTLSTGDAKAAIPRDVMVAHNKAKEEALFRSVYTSFAPSKDESVAIIPDAVKNRIWWDRVGKPEPPLVFESSINNDDDEDADLLDEAAFENMISSWKPDSPKLDADIDRDSSQDKDTEEVLKEISELLETLHAYQTSRHLPLPKSRSAVGHSLQISEMTGSPSTPSNAEYDVYTILKAQLTLLISSLPPYAVAKLNGDQLADLNVSTLIRARRENCAGSMDPSQIGARRAADIPTAVATPRATPMTTGRSQYASSQYRGQALTAPRSNQAMPSHYTAMPHQSPVRPPQSLPRSHGANMSTPVGYSLSRGIPNSNQRAMQTYPTTPSYNQVNGSRPVYDASNTNSPRYFQNQGLSHMSNATNHLTGSRQPSQPGYQPHAPVNPARSQAYSTPYAATPQAPRSASPLKQTQATPYSMQGHRPRTPLQPGQQASQQSYYQNQMGGALQPVNAASPQHDAATRQANQMTQMANMVTIAQQQILAQKQQIQQQQQQAAMAGLSASTNSHGRSGEESTWQQNTAQSNQDQNAALTRQQAQFQRPTSSTGDRSGSRTRAMRNANGADGDADELA